MVHGGQFDAKVFLEGGHWNEPAIPSGTGMIGRLYVVALVSASLAFPQSAKQINGSKVVIEAPVAGEDILKVIADLKRAGASPKSEFETTGAFEARIANVPEKFKKQMVFPLVLGASQEITYNADLGVFSVNVSPSFPISGSQVSGSHVLEVLPLRRVVHEYPPYMASNSFGMTKPISRKVIEEQGIEIRTAARLIGLQFPLDSARASNVKPFLCLAVQGAISQALVYSGTLRHAPTMSEPADSSVAGEYVPVTVTQFLAIDIRDGSLVAAIPLR
jgi:hypothetical protein